MSMILVVEWKQATKAEDQRRSRRVLTIACVERRGFGSRTNRQRTGFPQISRNTLLLQYSVYGRALAQRDEGVAAYAAPTKAPTTCRSDASRDPIVNRRRTRP
jgi:hypothetical protein